MANKWFGIIGFANTVETAPGVWMEQITEREYYGDITRNNRRLESNPGVNSDINISNTISIVADPYAMNHFRAMRYLIFGGAKWRVSTVDVAFPRLNLTLGGVYTEED